MVQGGLGKKRSLEVQKAGLGVESLVVRARHSPAHGQSHLEKDHRLCLRGNQGHRSLLGREEQNHLRSRHGREDRRSHLEEQSRHGDQMEERQVLWHERRQERRRRQDQWAEPWSLRERGIH